MPGAITVRLDAPAYEAGHAFRRADLYFHGVDHSWSSFEARVFLNHSDATEDTKLTPQQRYAGSFFVFGHGGCYGDEGHCDIPPSPVSPFDRRPAHQLTPTSKLVVVTRALDRLYKDGAPPAIHVTAVAVVRASAVAQPDHAANVLHFERVALLVYQ